MSFAIGGIIEYQILHTTTTRTLHAHNFNKSSTQATHALTDVLSRYLALLAETCAQYAQHAGRTGLNVRDVLAALEEIGIDIDDLREYVEGEAKEMVRYTAQTARRAEELAELTATVSEGLKQDHSDVVQLVYASIPDVDVSWPSRDEDEEHESESQLDNDVNDVNEENAGSMHEKEMGLNFGDARPLEPSGELTPSNDAKMDGLGPLVSIPSSSTILTSLNAHPKPETLLESQPIARPPSPPLPASSTSSYFTSIPYEHSSLSSTPEWHLPKPPPQLSTPATSSTLPALISSHSYLQSSSLSTPSLQPPNPLRHGLAMMLLGVSSRAYSPAATLFASSNTNTCAPLPRRAAPLAAHAVVLDKNGKANFNVTTQKGVLPVPPPEWHARSAAGPIAIVDSTTAQGSRIPILARTILSAPVVARTTRLIPPSPLVRNDQQLLYGSPVPASWNKVSGVNATEGKGVKGGKDNDDEEEEEDRVLSDAHLFATWDYDLKDFRAGLPMAKRGSKIGLGYGGANGTMPSMKRKRTDSVAPSRRGCEAGPALTRIKTER